MNKGPRNFILYWARQTLSWCCLCGGKGRPLSRLSGGPGGGTQWTPGPASFQQDSAARMASLGSGQVKSSYSAGEDPKFPGPCLPGPAPFCLQPSEPQNTLQGASTGRARGRTKLSGITSCERWGQHEDSTHGGRVGGEGTARAAGMQIRSSAARGGSRVPGSEGTRLHPTAGQAPLIHGIVSPKLTC